MNKQEQESRDQVIIDGWKSTTDSIPLMHALARMAGIRAGHFRRMVLVLDYDDMPRLYTEGHLNSESGVALPETKLQSEDRPMIVDMTSMQNREFRTVASSDRPREAIKQLTDMEFMDEFKRRGLNIRRLEPGRQPIPITKETLKR